MDSLSDQEIESIWDRIKQNIEVRRIKGKTTDEIADGIQQLLLASTANEEQTKTLIKYGFPERASEVDSIKRELLPKPISQPPILPKIPKDRVKINTKTSRAVVTTRRGKKTYLQKNLSIRTGTFKGKTSYYITNLRTGKRVTWGVLNE